MFYPYTADRAERLAAQKKALADGAGGRPGAYAPPADLLASIAAAGARR